MLQIWKWSLQGVGIPSIKLCWNVFVFCFFWGGIGHFFLCLFSYDPDTKLCNIPQYFPLPPPSSWQAADLPSMYNWWSIQMRKNSRPRRKHPPHSQQQRVGSNRSKRMRCHLRHKWSNCKDKLLHLQPRKRRNLKYPNLQLLHLFSLLRNRSNSLSDSWMKRRQSGWVQRHTVCCCVTRSMQWLFLSWWNVSGWERTLLPPWLKNSTNVWRRTTAREGVAKDRITSRWEWTVRTSWSCSSSPTSVDHVPRGVVPIVVSLHKWIHLWYVMWKWQKNSIQKILLLLILLLFKIGLKEDTCRSTVDRSVEQYS